jgi:hypothetical protein
LKNCLTYVLLDVHRKPLKAGADENGCKENTKNHDHETR